MVKKMLCNLFYARAKAPTEAYTRLAEAL